MEIGYILTLVFLAIWLGVKVAEKIIKDKQKKELEKASLSSDAEKSDINDLLL